MASDQGIKSCPEAEYYLFDFTKSVEVWPYDDQGMDVVGRMDVVGPNHEFLATLFAKYSDYLLNYDPEAMNAIFSKKS